MPRRAVPAVLAALAGFALLPAAAAARPSVLLAFVPDAPAAQRESGPDPLLRELARRPALAIGLMGATQGGYSPEQTLLDITQGTRVSPIAYEPRDPPLLRLAQPARGRGGEVFGWRNATRRAASAPGKLQPGLLASAVGGAAYVDAAPRIEAIAAADRRGRVAAVSFGPASTLVARTRELMARHRFVVASLPAVRPYLDELLARLGPQELLIVTANPPPADRVQLLPVGEAGLRTAGRGLTSDTTRRAGLVTDIDILPTVLGHLRVRVPSSVRGESFETGERRSPAQLEDTRVRFGHVAPRRIRTLEALLAAWALLLAVAAIVARRAGLRRALRIGALAFLWVPAVVLLPAAIDPARATTETLIVVGGAFFLGALTDLLLSWPRGPLLPAAVCLLAYSVDLAAGTNLINVSLLGPNPRAGARFFGIGNELEPALPFLLFLGLAAVMAGGARSGRRAATFAICGLAVGLIVGSGYLGADVGGVITVSAGTAVAAILMLRGSVTRRRVAAALLAPMGAVVALALLDLATGANSHFSRNFLESGGGSSDVWDVISRRYEFALHALFRGKMPFVTALAILGLVAAYRYRDRLYAPLPDPAWRAALAGGAAAGVAGALTNDSGPLLFVVAIFILGVATAYVQGGAGLPVPGHLGGGRSESPETDAPGLQESVGSRGAPAGTRARAQIP